MDEHIQEIALRFYEALDCPVSLSCAILLRNKQYDQIATRATDPRDYNHSDQYFRAASANDLLRKYPKLPTTFSKSERALEVWWAAEHACFRTNRRLTDMLEGEKPSAACIEFFDACRKTASATLGRVPTDLKYRFGPGATYSSRGVHSLLPNKLSNTPEMTWSAWPFLRDVTDTAWFRCLSDRPFEKAPLSIQFNEVRGNRYLTVPKDSKIDRPIAIEPSLNIFIQLGLGDALRRGLNRQNLLLSNAQENHRTLARRASADGSLATIDLSSASDTVAYELVRHMLPDSWFELLAASRSPCTLLPSGQWVHLEKFSSMGNGYTFELETLIFSTLCKVAADKAGVQLTPLNFSVYGDDIIIPIELAKVVMELLSFAGFTINAEKSHVTGPFRESCGGDFFNGDPVRPVQLKTCPNGPPVWFSLHNQLAGHPYGGACLNYIRQQLPKKFRALGGSKRLGDIVLHGITPVTKCEDSIHYTKTLQPYSDLIPLKRWDDYTALACLLYGVDSEGVTPRGDPSGYRIGWVADS